MGGWRGPFGHPTVRLNGIGSSRPCQIPSRGVKQGDSTDEIGTVYRAGQHA